ncbi:MAG: FAD-binding oxidoreductase [Pseudomonadota bacterium]
MSKPDLLVIGAGVFGLWTALSAARDGLRVIVTDRAEPGAGASGGIVGALTPHMPVRWRALKQFQLDALLTLEAATRDLTEATGIDTGYTRCGRLSPLVDARARARAEEHAVAAETVWAGRARFEVLDRPPPDLEGMLPESACPEGLVHDTLSGRVTPRGYITALTQAVEQVAEIRRGWTATHVATGRACFDRGEIAADQIVLAAGWQSFSLAPVASGSGVKGQAALLQSDLPPDMPVIQMPHLYVVAHGPGRVAVGSTSEKSWEHDNTDALLDIIIARARAVFPALTDAPVIERWAGIRPKAPGREPMIGPVPGHPGLWMATGGYKIGLGIAHLSGKALAAEITGSTTEHPLPADFAPFVPVPI